MVIKGSCRTEPSQNLANVSNALVENYQIAPTTTPEADLAELLGA